jgi:hypothetical protein
MYADFQNEIYLNGLNDVLPSLPSDLTRLESLAEAKLSREAYDYVAGSAGTGDTARANREAFRRWRLVPQMLRGTTACDLTTRVLGQTLPTPVLLGPVGVLRQLHPEGELAVARAAEKMGVPMVLSTAASVAMEEVAEVAGPRWYQLYWPNDRDLAISFLDRAKAAGYSALVVTLDTFTLAWRPHDLDNAYLPFLRSMGNQNYFSDPVFSQQAGDDPLLHWVAMFGNPSLTWDDLAFLREHWDGPIALKGIQHTDDARRAAGSPRWTRWPRSRTPSATRSTCCSTAASVRAPMSSRRSRWARRRCCWAARTRTGWRSRARRGYGTCCGACSPISSSRCACPATPTSPRRPWTSCRTSPRDQTIHRLLRTAGARHTSCAVVSQVWRGRTCRPPGPAR